MWTARVRQSAVAVRPPAELSGFVIALGSTDW
jgi:hypothetical protein